jgi:LacI family transcriptional regulator
MGRAKRKEQLKPDAAEGRKSISLRTLAEHLDLSPATVSLVINRSPVADSIPPATKNRILAAAKKLKYRPNFMARSLRKQRSFTIGVMVPEVSEGYASAVMSGIEDHLLQEGYFYFVVSHRHRADLIEEYPRLLFERSVEGIIAVDTPYRQHLPIPATTVSGHVESKGVTNITLDHAKAAELALTHLQKLGHRRVAFIKGQAFSSDTEVRWKSIVNAARKHSLQLDPKLVVQLKGDSPSPDVGFEAVRELLCRSRDFTALFAFNDISAIGVIRGIREGGLRVPQDVSVVGFDDIQSAAYQNPGLTTVRQPLRKMGEIAAQVLLQRINGQKPLSSTITVEPELVVRGTTGPVSG